MGLIYDKVTASNYRKDGMYDAVSSATTTKSTKLKPIIGSTKQKKRIQHPVHSSLGVF